ncbi:MAG: tetratricopeptide (TPR) repeat protein [Planctomycetota bacterium]|jgi:tetratricopeptide (TPR) repeat protein
MSQKPSYDPIIFQNAMEGLADICAGFQFDLSCLVDGELDERASGRALLHLESCPSCAEFFEDTRRYARLHRDIGEPERLMARLAALTGSNSALEIEGFDLVHRLASIFYQLGKAYTLAALDPDFHRRIAVFEEAVAVEDTKNRGRGFVDGVMLGSDRASKVTADGIEGVDAQDPLAEGASPAGRVDWQHARHMLNGRLEKIEDPLEKGRRLLEEAISVDSSHEEAKLYLANTHKYQNRPIKAFETYLEVFDTAVNIENRAHASAQLGNLYKAEGNHRKALVYWRWVTMNGISDQDDRFWYLHFNIGLVHAMDKKPERALASFRSLLDRHPSHAKDFASQLQGGRELKEAIESQEGFAEAFLAACPELFQDPGAWGDSKD